MPSSKKTPHLRLNKWMGADKPKKDDFNEDNQIIDQMSISIRDELTSAVLDSAKKIADAGAAWDQKLATEKNALLQKINQNATAASKNVTDTAAQIRTEIGSMQTSLTGQITAASNSVSTHAANSTLHLTAAERSKWNQMTPVVGTYTGNAATTRKITLGFAPSGGFVYAVGEPIAKTIWGTQSCNIWSAFFSKSGAGGGTTLQSDGFTVINNMNNSIEGFAYKLNENGLAYAYVVWR